MYNTFVFMDWLRIKIQMFVVQTKLGFDIVYIYFKLLTSINQGELYIKIKTNYF